MELVEQHASPRRGGLLPGVTGPVRPSLILIHRDQAGSPTDIEVVPKMPRDCAIFYRRGPAKENAGGPLPAYAREVAWMVNDLRDQERIVISPKSAGFDPFATPTFTITFPEQFVLSGPVDVTHLPQNSLPPYPWAYEVRLERAGESPIVLDPTVIIDEDP